ncbi:hypothetical protein NQ317_018775 [Molorchus minor]|uniref:Uncharacterized protein n=1 Tax=Molorchus minor TaxID=1323400 RepID=A0ABQ9IRV1_9CUCU|nr:hypothetical protein NQ317_018775 [Molorchus minor]
MVDIGLTTNMTTDPGHLSIRIKHIVVGQLTAVVTAPKSRSSAGWFSLQFEIEETGSTLVKVVLKKTCQVVLKIVELAVAVVQISLLNKNGTCVCEQ